MQHKARGFTIIELLIVIVVIAILATISIVAYNGVQERAKASAQASLVSQTERSIGSDLVLNGADKTALTGTLLAYQDGVGNTKLAQPIIGAADITMYAVYSVYNAATSYSLIAALSPNSSSQKFQLDTNNSGNASLRYRIDTSAQVNQSAAQGGVRVAGNMVIGWLQSSNGATIRSFGYNSSASTNDGTLAAHSNWNFTLLNTYEDTSGSTRAALIFTGAHDQSTRRIVIQWLAKKYGIAGTFV